MGFDFNFRFVEERKDIRELEKHLLQQLMNYPHYEDWVNRSIQELENGYKNSILAFSEGFLVGNLMFQPHKQFSSIMEFKNMRVHKKLQGRYFGSFMVKQAEAEARKKGYKAIVGDTRSDNFPIMNMLKILGYEELLRVPLYDQNVEDVVMVKKFDRTDKGLLLPIKKSIIYSA